MMKTVQRLDESGAKGCDDGEEVDSQERLSKNSF